MTTGGRFAERVARGVGALATLPGAGRMLVVWLAEVLRRGDFTRFVLVATGIVAGVLTRFATGSSCAASVGSTPEGAARFAVAVARFAPGFLDEASTCAAPADADRFVVLVARFAPGLFDETSACAALANADRFVVLVARFAPGLFDETSACAAPLTVSRVVGELS